MTVCCQHRRYRQTNFADRLQHWDRIKRSNF